MARDFKCRPSAICQITDDVEALDIDLAASFVLLRFDNKQAKERADYLVNELTNKIATMLGGESDGAGEN